MFGFCITHILNTGELKFEEKKRRQKVNYHGHKYADTCFNHYTDILRHYKYIKTKSAI